MINGQVLQVLCRIYSNLQSSINTLFQELLFMMGLELRLFCLGSQGLAPAYSYIYCILPMGPQHRLSSLGTHASHTHTSITYALWVSSMGSPASALHPFYSISIVYYIQGQGTLRTGPRPRILILLLPIAYGSNSWSVCQGARAPATSYFYYLQPIGLTVGLSARVPGTQLLHTSTTYSLWV